MSPFKFFGEILAKYINKKVLPSTGLIRLAYKLDFPEKDPNTITYKEMEYVFTHSLKDKLETLKIENTDQVINNMLKQLKLNQSLINLSK